MVDTNDQEVELDDVEMLTAIMKGFGSEDCCLSPEQLEKIYERDHIMSAIQADAQTVYEKRYDGKFGKFIEAFMTEIARATANGDNPVEEVRFWLDEEIEALEESDTLH